MLKEISQTLKRHVLHNTHTKSGALNKRNISSAVRIPVSLFLFSAIHLPGLPGVWEEYPHKLLTAFAELNVKRETTTDLHTRLSI